MARNQNNNEEVQDDLLIETTPDNTTPVEFAPTQEPDVSEKKEDDSDDEAEAKERFGEEYDIHEVKTYGNIVNVIATVKGSSTNTVLSYTKGDSEK